MNDRARPSRLGQCAYPGLLLALTLLFFAQPLARGLISVPLDTLGFMYPWMIEARPTFASAYPAPQQNSVLEDQLTVLTPFHLFARQEIRQLRIPLWTPLEMGGAPFLANDQSAVLYPVNLVGDLLSPAAGLQLQRVVRPLGAGLGMYLFLLALSLRRPAALFGAIGFMFSSFVILWLGWPLSAVATWLPWSFLAVERLLQPGTRRLPWIAALAAATGLHLLAGHIETSFHILLAICLYVLAYVAARAWTWRSSPAAARDAVGKVAAVASGIVLGVAMAAVQLLPTAHYLFDSVTYETRSSGQLAPPQPLANLGFWLIPNVSGNPAYAYRNVFPAELSYDSGLNYNERTGYVGVITLVCAVMAFVYPSRRLRWQRSAFALMLVIVAGSVYGIQPIHAIAGALPLIGTTNNYRMLLIACFGVAALGAIGLDGIIDRLGPDTPWRWSRWREPSVIGGIVCVVPALAFSLAAAASSTTHIGRFMQWWSRADSPVDINVWTRSWTAFGLILLVSSLILLTMLAAGRIERRLGLATIMCLLVGDLFVFGVSYNPQVSPRYLYPSTPLTDAMRGLGPQARFVIGQGDPATLAPALIPNLATPYNLRDLSAYDGILATRPYRLMNAVNRHGPNRDFGNRILPNAHPDRHLLAVANVTYAVLPTEAAQDGLTPVWHDDRHTLFAVDGARPRVYVAGKILFVNDGESALSALDRLQVPGSDAVVETTEPLTSAGGDATILRDLPGDITVRVSTAAAGLLVLNEGYGDGGWRATVDSRTAPILHANYLYQGAVVPAGQHTVHFTYRPPAFVAGAAISVVAMTGWAALLAASAVKKRRPTDRLTVRD